MYQVPGTMYRLMCLIPDIFVVLEPALQQQLYQMNRTAKVALCGCCYLRTARVVHLVAKADGVVQRDNDCTFSQNRDFDTNLLHQYSISFWPSVIHTIHAHRHVDIHDTIAVYFCVLCPRWPPHQLHLLPATSVVRVFLYPLLYNALSPTNYGCYVYISIY